jgi:hypothetical protein
MKFEEDPVKFHTFVLTGLLGGRLYGFCLVFPERHLLPAAPRTATATTSLAFAFGFALSFCAHSHSGLGSTPIDTNTTAGPPPPGHRHWPKYGYVSKCLCIVSQKTFMNTFKRYLASYAPSPPLSTSAQNIELGLVVVTSYVCTINH